MTELTDGRMADQVIDTTPTANQAVVDAIRCVRPGGTVVLGGVKGRHPVDGLFADEITLRDVVVKGVLSVDSWAFEQAIAAIESGRYPLDQLHTHTIPIDNVERGFQLIGAEIPGEDVLHITVVPSLD